MGCGLSVHKRGLQQPGSSPPPSADLAVNSPALLTAPTAEEGSKLTSTLELLTKLFQVPIAVLTTISGQQLCLRAAQGLSAAELSPVCDEWGKLVCHQGVLVVEDARHDSRFSGLSNLEFYAGVALVGSTGQRLGTLSVLDTVPRLFCPQATTVLARFAEIVVRELEREQQQEAGRVAHVRTKALASRGKSLQQLFSSLEHQPEGLMVCSLARCLTEVAQWRILYVNAAWCRVTGLSTELARSANIWSLFRPEDRKIMAHPVLVNDNAIQAQMPFRMTVVGRLQSRTLQVCLKPVGAEGSDASTSLMSAPALYIGTFSRPEVTWAGNKQLCVKAASGDSPCSSPRIRAHVAREGAGSEAARTLAASSSSSTSLQGKPRSCGSSAGIAPSTVQPQAYQRSSRMGCGGSRLAVGESEQEPKARQRHRSMESKADPELGPSTASSSSSSANMLFCPSGPSHSSSIPTPKRASGQIFGEIQLGPLLGKGSYGRVYYGTWRGAAVAVKVVECPAPSPGSPFMKRGGVLEACLSKDLCFPSVVSTYDFAVRPLAHPMLPCSPGLVEAGADTGLVELWIVQELCDAGTLDAAIQRGAYKMGGSSRCDMPAALTTLSELAGAMAYLHHRGVLHTDLNARNVLLHHSNKDSRQFVAKVCDFGLSRIVGVGNTTPLPVTRTYGTVTHQPPELLLHGVLSRSVDVWAFGVLMWEVFTGSRAFQGKRSSQVIHAVTVQRAGLPIPPDMPEQYRGIMQRCLAYDPAQRPSFDVILKEVRALLRSLQGW